MIILKHVMGINISERKARPPTVGGLLLPEEILRITRKATRTSVFCLCLMVFFLGGWVAVMSRHGFSVVIYLKTATWMSLG